MEHKIGEIFEYNGSWFQCIGNPYNECTDCDFCFEIGRACVRKVVGQCSMSNRSDGLSVAFKKLEKWGEPYPNADKLYQLYRLPMNIEKLPHTEGINLVRFDIVEIEIKQNKENMEEKKQKLDDLVGLYTSAKITYKEFDEKLKTLYADKEECKSSLKEFDLEAAKAGKPVCTRDGRKVRIICFDAKRKDKKKIIALVPSKDYPGFEDLIAYPNNGNYYGGHENDGDLMMLPERKEGWVNVYNDTPIYDTKERAELGALTVRKRIATVKISWEE